MAWVEAASRETSAPRTHAARRSDESLESALPRCACAEPFRPPDIPGCTAGRCPAPSPATPGPRREGNGHGLCRRRPPPRHPPASQAEQNRRRRRQTRPKSRAARVIPKSTRYSAPECVQWSSTGVSVREKRRGLRPRTSDLKRDLAVQEPSFNSSKRPRSEVRSPTPLQSSDFDFPGMFRMSLKKFQRMRNQLDGNFERFHRPGRTPRQIEDQRPAVHSTNATAQRSKRRLLHSFAAHAFGHAIQHAVTNRPSCLGSDVARCNPGSSGCDHERDLFGQQYEELLNLEGIILHDFALDDLKAESFERLSYRWSRQIDALAARARIADGNHRRREVCRYPHLSCRGEHRPPLPSHGRTFRRREWRLGLTWVG